MGANICRSMDFALTLTVCLECPTSHLLCNDGETCLEPDLFCNGVVDCPDKSDEPGGCEAKDDHKGSGVISNPNYEFEK